MDASDSPTRFGVQCRASIDRKSVVTLTITGAREDPDGIDELAACEKALQVNPQIKSHAAVVRKGNTFTLTATGTAGNADKRGLSANTLKRVALKTVRRTLNDLRQPPPKQHEERESDGHTDHSALKLRQGKVRTLDA